MEQTYLSTTPNKGLQPGASVMDAVPPIGRDHNKFELSYANYLTARYGEITPFFAMEAVERDKVPFGSSHEIRSYTMSAPLMSRIRMCKDYFSVPKPAMLRRNWDIIYRTPKRGDDVPMNAGLSIKFTAQNTSLIQTIKSRMTKMVTALEKCVSDTSFTSIKLAGFLKYHFFLESILSPGSLLNVMGYHAHTYCRYTIGNGPERNYDDFAENLYAELKKCDMKITITYGSTKKVYYYVGSEYHFTSTPLGIRVDFHRMLDLLRNNLTAESQIGIDSGANAVLASIITEFGLVINSLPNNFADFNYERLIAYQAVASQFFTNDNVDNLYTFELYEQNAYALSKVALSSSSSAYEFTYNGTQRLFDTYSGSIVNAILKKLYASQSTTDFNVSTTDNYVLAYLNTIFGFRKSLRYSDYFNGARTSPLAVGDVNAPVVSSKVSAIDITKNILMQRFLNAVAKVGSRFEEYAKGIFGANPGPDYHEPKFVCHSVFNVGANEVDNTAENQGNIVQTLRSTGDKFEFELDYDIPSILIGVCYFDSPLVYSRNADRAFFKTDRYDEFNPMLQNIGDQPILAQELNVARIDDDHFGYAPRYTEYKTRVSVASGGFVKNLPAWAFISDNDNSGIVSGSDDVVSIDSDFIRSNPAEFDRFYSALTGSSLSSYFHFILRFDNTCRPLRPMEYASTIL